MADEAFALSPISARATLPSEEDYDAISQAFMETSRGRWFLGEYARRNRNADTRMVLDAVARIEQTIAAQKQPAESGLAEALAGIRRAVNEAHSAAAAAVEGLALEESLAPIRKGARIIREISWRWREIGADSRICDLIDSQIGAIEGACGHISSADALGAVSAAFDLVKARIAEFDDGDAGAAPAAEESVASASPAAQDETPAVAAETMQERSAGSHAEAAIGSSATPVEAVAATAEPLVVITEVADLEVADLATEVADLATEVADPATEAADLAIEAADVNFEPGDPAADAADVTSEAPDVSYEVADTAGEPVADVTPEAAGESSEAADAYDESLLDMIALEMAAPDPADGDDVLEAETDEIDTAELPPADPDIAAARPEPMAAAEEPPAMPPTLQPALESSPEASLEPSLGSSLIANEIVRRPQALASDPLAPIRRMSQAEKVAFFS